MIQPHEASDPQEVANTVAAESGWDEDLGAKELFSLPQPFSPPFGEIQQQALLEVLRDYTPGPCIRHSLSPSQNSEVRTILEDSFDQLKGRILGLASHPNPRFSDALQAGEGFIEKAVAGHSLSNRASGEATEAGVCAMRDIKRFESSFQAAVHYLRYLNLEAQENLAKRSEIKPGDPAARHALAPSLMDRFVSTPTTQEDLDAAARQVSVRFGFDGVGFMNETVEPRQRMRWLDRSAKAMQESCKRLGIAEHEFGHHGGVSFVVLPPQTNGNRGMFLTGGFPGSQMHLDASSPYPAGTLTHEFMHELDHVLGVKTEEKLRSAGLSLEDSEFIDKFKCRWYSELPQRLQETLPDAKQGLDKMMGVLSVDSLSTRLSASLQKMAAGGGEAGEAASELVLGKEREREFGERMSKLTDGFLVKAIGMEKMHGLGKIAFEQIKSSLRAEDDKLLLSTINNITCMPPRDAFISAIDEHYKANGEAHPFLFQMGYLTNGTHMPDITKAITSSRKEFSEVAAMLHPSNLASKPSPMLEKSIVFDITNVEDVPGRPYRSAPTELLARLVDRPQSLRQMHIATQNPGWQQPLSEDQVEKLQKGLSALYRSAGIQVKKSGPQLSMGDELAAHAASKIVFKPLDAAAQMAQSFGRMMGKGDSNEPVRKRIAASGP